MGLNRHFACNLEIPSADGTDRSVRVADNINGWIVAPEQNRNNTFADFIVLRVQRRYPGDRSVIDHTVAEAKKKDDDLGARYGSA